MTEAIIIQLIIGAITVITVHMQNRSSEKQKSEEFEYRIGSLEKKVEKHNNMIERVYVLEQKVEDMEK